MEEPVEPGFTILTNRDILFQDFRQQTLNAKSFNCFFLSLFCSRFTISVCVFIHSFELNEQQE